MTKVTITEKQKQQFNNMRAILIRIGKEYQKPPQIKKDSQTDFGLDYEEALEMAYENIQNDACFVIKGVRKL